MCVCVCVRSEACVCVCVCAAGGVPVRRGSSSSEALLCRDATLGEPCVCCLMPFFQRNERNGDLDRDRWTLPLLRGVLPGEAAIPGREGYRRGMGLPEVGGRDEEATMKDGKMGY